MWKKLMISAFAMVLGATAVHAKDLVTIEVYFSGEGSVALVGNLPKGMFRAATKKGSWGVMHPYFIDLGKAQSLELKFRATGKGKFSPALYAFRREEGKKNQSIPVECKVFEVDEEPVPSVPCIIDKWKRMTSREVENGDEIVIKAEFKPVAE
jgi:hypothetical protein